MSGVLNFSSEPPVIDRKGLALLSPDLAARMVSIAYEEGDDGTSPRETPQQQQPASLLSLPDELLVQIFDNLAERLWKGIHPLWPLTHVCRRVRTVTQVELYRDVVIGPYRNKTPHFYESLKENPSLGQLVETLTVHGTVSFFDSDSGKEAIHDSELVQATTSAVSNLKELVLSGMTTAGASFVLAALPSTSLRNLYMRFFRTPASVQWSDLRAHVARSSELRMLTFQDWRPETEPAPHTTTHPGQHLLLPQLVKLQVNDYILVQFFGAAVPLWQALPNLRELQITISSSQDSSTVKAILSEAPSSLTTLKLLSNYETLSSPRQYLPTLPVLPHLSHLDLGPGTFIESELLVYLPMAPLESITFDLCAAVTDRILQALTGPARSPRLRRLCLDHVVGAGPEGIRHHLQMDLSGGAVEDLRHQVCPEWPTGGTEHGLRLALAAANAHGLEVTGSALDCAVWNEIFDKVLSDFMMEQAHETDNYGDVIARFGEEVAIAWLEEHAPDRLPLLREQMSALQLDDAVL